jgi:membrane protease YdiL (CAAX protease family)
VNARESRERRGPALINAFIAAATATWLLLSANLLASPLLAMVQRAGLSPPLVFAVNGLLAETGILAAVVVAIIAGRLDWGAALGTARRPELWPTVWSLLCIAGGGVVLDEVTFLLARALPAAVSERLIAAGAVIASATPGEAALMLVSLALLPALCEEALCRGVILRGLLPKFEGRRGGAFWPVVISSAFFGMLHVDPLHVTIAALMGVLLGLIAVRTGGLWPAVLCHLLNNVVSILTPRLGGPGLDEVLRRGHAWWLVAAGAAAFGLGLAGLLRSTSRRAPAGSDDDEQHGRADAQHGQEE